MVILLLDLWIESTFAFLSDYFSPFNKVKRDAKWIQLNEKEIFIWINFYLKGQWKYGCKWTNGGHVLQKVNCLIWLAQPKYVYASLFGVVVLKGLFIKKHGKSCIGIFYEKYCVSEFLKIFP